MTISSAGLLAWAKPVIGNYAVTVTAKDGKTGLSAQAKYTVQISAGGPVITGAPMTGVAGKPMTGVIGISDAGAQSISITISGAPMGMTFMVAGMNITAAWNSPSAGSYQLKVALKDSGGASAQLAIPVTVAAR